MSQFDNVSILKNANVYFDGKVTSRTILLSDGSKKTLGIMMPGDYEFNTDQKEIVEVLNGSLEVLLPGSSHWQPLQQGDTFEVPANSVFQLKILKLMDYCCSYIK